MVPPLPPWSLQGHAIQTVHLINIDRVRPLIPAELDIISVLPGKTIGGVYIASYGQESTLTYNELIVVSGLVHQSNKVGGWISHIYVDHPGSVAGGREFWGLPKELAQFTWETSKDNKISVQVSQDNTLLCHLNCQWQFPGWQQPLTVPVFSLLNSKLVMFEGQASFKHHLIGAQLDIPSESPFAPIEMGRAWLSFALEPLTLVAHAPRAVA